MSGRGQKVSRELFEGNAVVATEVDHSPFGRHVDWMVVSLFEQLKKEAFFEIVFHLFY